MENVIMSQKTKRGENPTGRKIKENFDPS